MLQEVCRRLIFDIEMSQFHIWIFIWSILLQFRGSHHRQYMRNVQNIVLVHWARPHPADKVNFIVTPVDSIRLIRLTRRYIDPLFPPPHILRGVYLLRPFWPDHVFRMDDWEIMMTKWCRRCLPSLCFMPCWLVIAPTRFAEPETGFRFTVVCTTAPSELWSLDVFQEKTLTELRRSLLPTTC